MTTLTATPNVAAGTVALAIAGAPRDGQNLVTNPSFETDTAGWSAYGTGTAITRSAAHQDSGSWSLRISTGTVSLIGANTTCAAIAGRTYAARARVKPGDVSDLRIRLIFRDGGGAQLATVAADAPASAAGAWVTLSVQGVAPAGTVTQDLYVQRYTGTTSGQFIYVDSVLVQSLGTGETFNPAVYYAGTRSGDVTLTRTDTRGTIAVRRTTGLVPSNGAMTLTDYEATLSGTITYTVTDNEGAVVTATTTLAQTGRRPRITNVSTPHISPAIPMALTGYEAPRNSATTVHWVEGRADPVVIMRPGRTREGTLEAMAGSYAAAASLNVTIRPGAVLMLRQADHPGMDMYFVVTESSLEPLERLSDGWRWSVRAQYVEVRSPAFDLAAGA